MANVSEKFGLRPYRKLDGTPLVGAQNRYTVKNNYATAIYQGDLVVAVSTGNIEKLAGAIADTLKIQAGPLGENPISPFEPIDLLFIGDAMYFGKANKRTCSFIDRLDPKMQLHK